MPGDGQQSLLGFATLATGKRLDGFRFGEILPGFGLMIDR